MGYFSEIKEPSEGIQDTKIVSSRVEELLGFVQSRL